MHEALSSRIRIICYLSWSSSSKSSNSKTDMSINWGRFKASKMWWKLGHWRRSIPSYRIDGRQNIWKHPATPKKLNKLIYQFSIITTDPALVKAWWIFFRFDCWTIPRTFSQFDWTQACPCAIYFIIELKECVPEIEVATLSIRNDETLSFLITLWSFIIQMSNSLSAFMTAQTQLERNM